MGCGGAGMPFALLHHPCKGERVSAELSTSHGHIPVWALERICRDSRDGGMGWARGVLPVPPSPSCHQGGDVGSCSTKPCSFSPLKPDYLAVPVCVRAWEGGGGGISQQQVFAATLGPAAPELPQGQQHSIRSRKALAVTAEPMALLEQPAVCAGHGSRAALGLGGGCCGSLRG